MFSLTAGTLLEPPVRERALYQLSVEATRLHCLAKNVPLAIVTIITMPTEGNEGNNPAETTAEVEDIPDDSSSIVYTYLGGDGEVIPPATTEVVFAPSATTIKEQAFCGCVSLERVTIPDTVTRIEDAAFYMCVSLRFIRFPRNLEWIGEYAFCYCKSLQALFLPSTVTHIGHYAFRNCKSLRSFYVPETIEHIGNWVVNGCDLILTTVKYEKDANGHYNHDEVNQWLKHQYDGFPLHKLCFSTSITPQEIEVCFQVHGIERAAEVDNQQRTALHILCANPRVTGDAIHAYLQLVPDTAGKTGLHILCANPFVTGDAIHAYLQLAQEAANEQDSNEMTPFQHLCRNDITFLEDRNFSSLMIWWYCCMPPQTVTDKKRKRSESVDAHDMTKYI